MDSIARCAQPASQLTAPAPATRGGRRGTGRSRTEVEGLVLGLVLEEGLLLLLLAGVVVVLLRWKNPDRMEFHYFTFLKLGSS